MTKLSFSVKLMSSVKRSIKSIFCWNLCYHFNALVNNSINFSYLMLGLSRYVWWVLSSEALFTAKKNYCNVFGNSFTRLLSLLCLIACLYAANLKLKTCFLARQTRKDSKGGFPLSCYFYGRTQVNFTRVNNIKPMYGRSRVNAKVELCSTLFKRAVSRQSSSFCLILPITSPQSLWNLK